MVSFKDSVGSPDVVIEERKKSEVKWGKFQERVDAMEFKLKEQETFRKSWVGMINSGEALGRLLTDVFPAFYALGSGLEKL